MGDVKHIDIAEFQRLGFLQEANRQFFHPHGLALEIAHVVDDGKYAFPQTYVGFDAHQLAALRKLLAAEQIDADVRDSISPYEARSQRSQHSVPIPRGGGSNLQHTAP